MKNKERVMGQLVDWVVESNKHYPLFSFVTKNGEKIMGRCREEIDNEILETSIETAYGEDAVQDLLSLPLPMNNINIIYNQENPKQFIAKWLLLNTADFKELNNNMEETVFQFIRGYILSMIYIIFPFFGVIPSLISAKRYLEEYQFENKRKSLIKSILYWILVGLGIVYLLVIIIYIISGKIR